jgi:tetratricopeptide (TPR) repeat protein
MLSSDQDADLEHTLSTQFEFVLGVLSEIDAKQAEATDPKDKITIFQKIANKEGFRAFNMKIVAAFRAWLMATARKQLAQHAVVLTADFSNLKDCSNDRHQYWKYCKLLKGLGRLELDLGSVDKSRSYFEQVLQLAERAQDEHMICMAFGDIGNVCFSLGKLEDAKTYYEKALRRYFDRARWPYVLKAAPPLVSSESEETDHQFLLSLLDSARRSSTVEFDTVDELARLAAVHLELGGYVSAREFYSSALSIAEQKIGPNGQRFVREALILGAPQHGIAVTYYKQERHADALKMFYKALATKERGLSPEHPHVAITLVGIARVRCAMREAGESIAMYKRALAIYEKVHGEDCAEASDIVGEMGQVATGHVSDEGRHLAKALVTASVLWPSG